MTFELPWVLLFLAFPILLGFWEWVRDSHAIVMPFDLAKRRFRDRLLGWAIRLCNLLPAFLLIIAILILAGPKRSGPPENDRIMTNILFCLDLSGSMGQSFGDASSSNMPRPYQVNGITTYEFERNTYTRYDAAVSAIRDFTSYREGDAFGLTVFGTEYLHWLPVTRDINALKTCVDILNPNSMPRWFGGTRIIYALRGCIKRMIEQPDGDRMIIVITDGEAQDYGDNQDIAVANELRDARITTYFVAINPEMTAAPLAGIAAATGGEALVCGDETGLNRVFKHIDQMQKAKMKQRAPEPVAYTAPFAVAGLIAVFLALGTLFGLRFTPW